MSRLIPVLVMIACAASLTACKDDGTPLDEGADRSKLLAMEVKIDNLIMNGTCGDPGDCRSIAFGAKPCGGPWSYKVYSVSGVDTLALADQVEAYNKLNAVLNERYGWMSDCMMVMPPDIGCVEGHCVAVR